MNNKSYYAIIPANVRYDKSIPNGAKLLYGEITSLCNERGYCWASNQYFSELYATSERTIINWIKALVREDYIYIKMVDNNKRSIFINKWYEKNFTPSVKKSSFPYENNFTHNTKLNIKGEEERKNKDEQLQRMIELANINWID
jgi:hypothetical protein